MTDVMLTIAGEEIYLLPERALWWPNASTLIVADLHWGKASTFRATGIPIPIGTTSDDLARLDSALIRTGARRMVVLGDLFHAKAGRIASHTLAELRRWRSLAAPVEILLVRGNHDRHAGDPPSDLKINCVNAPAFVPPFVFRHEPVPQGDAYGLAGHVHHEVRLNSVAVVEQRQPAVGCVYPPRAARTCCEAPGVDEKWIDLFRRHTAVGDQVAPQIGVGVVAREDRGRGEKNC